MPNYKVSMANTWSQELQNVCEEAIRNLPVLDLSSRQDVKKIIEDIVSADARKTALFVLYADTHPVGILLGTLVNNHPIMDNANVAHEMVWYVTPAHRGNQSFDLVTHFEAWARMINARACTMSHFDDEIGRALGPIYRDMGYTPIEHSYIKGLT